MKHPIIRKDSVFFTVWAPQKKTMTLHLLIPNGADLGIAMQKEHDGCFSIDAKDASAGTRYYYMPQGEKSFPDPASHYQPQGVHGPSEVIDHTIYQWQDSHWKGIPLSESIFYEIHTGAFTPEGTFEAIIPRLDDLATLGINAIELMPIAAFPGTRNWGYDCVYPYAVQNTYGGPEGLKKLVDACHQKGIAVYLDVVYNHFGREGNNCEQFGPYCTQKYQTPWGPALNFDGAWSDGVKDYIIQNVLYWADHYHLDGLRLDAIHEMFDRNAITIWNHLHTAVKNWEERNGRRFHLIAESDANNPKTVCSPATGGQGFDAQWLDDFHHSLYVLIDPEGWKHYQDFGGLEQLAKAYIDGFVHSGEYVHFRHRQHGASSAHLPGHHFLVFNQNHDLPGNRPDGKRLASLVDFARLKLAAAALLLSPYIPLLFMGEEYGEDNPFYFFSDYSDPDITTGLKEGRKKEFADFGWDEEAPSSQEPATFERSKLQWEKRKKGDHALLLKWHTTLIQLRKTHPLLKDLSKDNLRADLIEKKGISVYRYSNDKQHHLTCFFNFSGEDMSASFRYSVDIHHRQRYDDPAKGRWTKILTSEDATWRKGSHIGLLPETIRTGGVIILPPWAVAVYAINLSAFPQP